MTELLLKMVTSMESIFEWHCIVDSKATCSPTGKAAIVLVKTNEQNLFLTISFHLFSIINL